MLKIWVILLFLFCLYVAWLITAKIRKTKRAIQRKSSELLPKSIAVHPQLQVSQEIVMNENDRTVFDDVAASFLQQNYCLTQIDQAEGLQLEWLNKMPKSSMTEIRECDLGEWSIIWHLNQQSLEYFVGRYGWFYTHVDVNGIEHRHEIRQQHANV